MNTPIYIKPQNYGAIHDAFVLNDDNRVVGTKEVKRQREDCRIPAMKKSIILNYS